MAAPLMRRLIREALVLLVPEDALVEAPEATTAGRETLLRAARRMRG